MQPSSCEQTCAAFGGLDFEPPLQVLLQRHDTLKTCMLRKKHSSSTKDWEFNSVVPDVAKKQAAALVAANCLEAEPRLEVGLEDQGIYWVQSASGGSCAT